MTDRGGGGVGRGSAVGCADSFNQRNAERVLRTLCPQGYIVTSVTPKKVDKSPYCRWAVTYQHAGHGHYEGGSYARRVFELLSHMQPVDASVKDRSRILQPPSYELVYAVRCACTTDFSSSTTSVTERPDKLKVSNVTAPCSIANIVKSLLGPVGLDKMLVDDIGDVTVTNDGATILRLLEVEHPAAKVLVELFRIQDEVGDGTTSARESVFIQGYALNCTVASQQMPKKILDAKIACLDFSLQQMKMELGLQVLSDPENLEGIRARERVITKECIDKIMATGVNVILSSGEIDDLCVKFFIEAGAMAVRRVEKADLKRIARATGATYLTSLTNMDGEESFEATMVGEASEVAQKVICDDELILIKGTRARTAASIILRGPICALHNSSQTKLLEHTDLKWAGVDLNEETVKDNRKAGVLEPPKIKEPGR